MSAPPEKLEQIWFAPPHLQWLRRSRDHHNNRLHLLCSTLKCREIQPIRRKDYDTTDLYRSEGRYGSWNITAFAILAIATFLGWGLVVNSSASCLNWQGYLLDPIGGKDGTWAAANLGVIIALAAGFLGTLLFQKGDIRRQESID